MHDLDYADDIALLADTAEAGQTFLDSVASVAVKLGLRISGPKTKVVSFEYDAPVITLDGTALEVVPAFVSLGSSISGDSTASSDDVECRIGKAAGAFARLKVCVWKQRNIRLTTKMIFNAVVITILLYASECWTLLLMATDVTKLGFPDELPSSNTWGDATGSLTE